jgi:hypothetical protein
MLLSLRSLLEFFGAPPAPLVFDPRYLVDLRGRVWAVDPAPRAFRVDRAARTWAVDQAARSFIVYPFRLFQVTS